MSNQGQDIIMGFKRRWQLLLVAEVALYSLGLALLVFVLSNSSSAALCCLILVSMLLLLFKKPWQLSADRVSVFLDEELTSMENSTGLFLVPEAQLSDLALLQRYKVAQALKTGISNLKPKVNLTRAFLVFLALLTAAFLLHYFDVFENSNTANSNPSAKEVIVFQAVDSVIEGIRPPRIKQQMLRINYPAYTRLAAKTTSNMNIKALEGSQIYWSIQFDSPVETVFIEKGAENLPLKLNDAAYLSNTKLLASGFYNFKFTDVTGASYLSELYALEVVKDEAPKIEIQQLKQFSTFDITDRKILKFNALISDDYGISDAYIIATVTKGAGEAVKFREERLSFEAIDTGSKKLNLHKTIDLDALQMDVGDELYFYIEAHDVKKPKANRRRSETFFAVIRDTVSNQIAVEGTMGADLMPDYFRSQRQLIIDTEKLIADRNTLLKNEFNAISNALGYDQKALRLKYGEFMGDEADSGIKVSQEIEFIEQENQNDENDPLAEYTHDHDSDNEHNLVDHEHNEESLPEEMKDPLHDYLHNHDDPEESTLFTQSLKSKLRQAMTEMWDAELQLRLYTPEKSLTYQYRALKLIQEIKNSARIYVHRIGFDPPPIKEEKRLTGAIDDVEMLQKIEERYQGDNFIAMRESVRRIAEIIAKKRAVGATDRKLFANAGNELAALAIEKPASYLNTLQGLKWVSEKKQTSVQQLLAVQSGLMKALPKIATSPNKERMFQDEINTLMLKELEIND